MPLWDQTSRQVQALPSGVTPAGEVDFIPVALGNGSVQRLALKSLRSRELISVPMYTALNGGSAASTIGTSSTNRGPLRVVIAPFSFVIEEVVVTCTTSSNVSLGFDVWVNDLSVFTGGNTSITNLTLAASSRRASSSTFSTGSTFSVNVGDNIYFWTGNANTTIRSPWLHLKGYRN